MHRKFRSALLLVAGSALGIGCAHGPPQELADARSTYDRASKGPAAQLDPADLYNAKRALDDANQSFDRDGSSDQTKDLAYVAQRRAEYAETQARIAQSNQKRAQAQQEVDAIRQQQIASAQQQAAQTRQQLEEAQRQQAAQAQALADQQQREQQLQQQLAELQRQQQDQQTRQQETTQQQTQREQQIAAIQQQLEQERQARSQAEQQRQQAIQAQQQAEAQAQRAIQSLDKVATVRREPRGVVISLSGSVLFASGKSTILPTARQRLDEVADALQNAEGTQRFVIEGYTDSRGSDELNQRLSQARAEAVRSYLVSHGVSPDRISAIGMGEADPVADNTTAEGRANNRRVEIVMQPMRTAQRQGRTVEQRGRATNPQQNDNDEASGSQQNSDDQQNKANPPKHDDQKPAPGNPDTDQNSNDQ